MDAYQEWDVVFGEVPSAAKWNILGTNDGRFNDINNNAATGWIDPEETWTYATANTITISGNVVSKYPVGTVVKLVQSSTTKYFTVTKTPTYSAPDTTVTLVGVSTETVANSAITGNYYSYSPLAVGITSLAAPVGTVDMYAGTTAPGGWLICNGQAISRTVYAALFAVIGTTFGSGDGSTTFNVPNLEGRFPIGKNGTYALGATGGAATINLQHTHTMGYGDNANNAGGTGNIFATSAHIHTNSNSLSSAQSILPPYLGINFKIKY